VLALHNSSFDVLRKAPISGPFFCPDFSVVPPSKQIKVPRSGVFKFAPLRSGTENLRKNLFLIGEARGKFREIWPLYAYRA